MGVWKKPNIDYVIFEQPLYMICITMFSISPCQPHRTLPPEVWSSGLACTLTWILQVQHNTPGRVQYKYLYTDLDATHVTPGKAEYSRYSPLKVPLQWPGQTPCHTRYNKNTPCTVQCRYTYIYLGTLHFSPGTAKYSSYISVKFTDMITQIAPGTMQHFRCSPV